MVQDQVDDVADSQNQVEDKVIEGQEEISELEQIKAELADANQAKLRALADFKNSYSTEDPAIKANPDTDGSAASNDDLGFVNLSDDGDTITIWTCFMKECTDSTSLVSNQVEIE